MRTLFVAGIACIVLASVLLLAIPHHGGNVPQLTAEQRHAVVARWEER